MRHRSPFIYPLTTIIILLALVLVGRSFAPERVQITILGTTDLHGNILPVDYYTNKPDTRGLAKVATLIKLVRKEHANDVLIDSGDAMAVGNHEYNFGLKVLEKARNEAKFPWLSANTYDTKTQKPHYKPYIIKELAGVRIGILGLTTPGIPNWDNPPNYAGLEFHEPLS